MIEFRLYSLCLLRPEFVGSSDPAKEVPTPQKFRLSEGSSDTFSEVPIFPVILLAFNLYVRISSAVLLSIIPRVSESAVTT